MDEGPQVDPVVVGLTRPPMMFFIPFNMLGIIVIGTTLLFIATANFLSLLVAVPLYGLAYLLANKDKRLVDIILLKARKCNAVRNSRFWGGNSYSP